MPSKEEIEKRLKLAESNLGAMFSTEAHGRSMVTIARAFRVHMDAGMRKATFNERECAISDLIDEIGVRLRAAGILTLRSHIEAWYYSCGVEVP